MSTFRDSIQTFFRSKATQLLAAAAEADTPHPALLGSHREALIRTFLAPFLPRRFAVGRGMVFGFAHRSQECDVVIWDADNYPCIQLQEYSHFFAESVRAVIESKSRYSSDALNDVLTKSSSTRSIATIPGSTIVDDIEMLKLEIESLRTAVPHNGFLRMTPHIATAAVFFRGGQNFRVDSLPNDVVDTADDSWPDMVLFLEAGKVVLKQYADSEDASPVHGYLETLSAGPDSLLVFAAALLAAVSDRSVQVEDPSFLAAHVDLERFRDGADRVDFRLIRFAPGRTPLWSRQQR